MTRDAVDLGLGRVRVDDELGGFEGGGGESVFFFFLCVCVGFRFVTNWNPIFKIHFLIFLNFLGNQTVDIPLFSCLCAITVFMGILVILIIG